MSDHKSNQPTNPYTDIEDTTFVSKPSTQPKTSKIDLKFANLENFNYIFFMKESFFFIFNNIFQRLPILICSILYKKQGLQDLIGFNDFVFILMDLVSSGLRDFQEIIPIVCGPYYSKNDFKNYFINRNRLILITVVGVFLFLLIIPFLEKIYNLMGVEEKSIESFISLGKYYVVYYAPFMAISNFLKGIT